MAKHPHAELIKQMVDDDSLQAECSVRLGKWTLASVTSCPEYDWREAAQQWVDAMAEIRVRND